MKPYQPWEFCKTIDCDVLEIIKKPYQKMYCQKCKAYKFHQYLKEHGQILEEGSELAKRLEGEHGPGPR